MSRGDAAHVHDRRTAHPEKLVEKVLQRQDRVLQGQHANTEQLARIEARVNERHPGGNPGKYQWRELYLEALWIEANGDGIPSVSYLRNKLKAAMASWDQQPTERSAPNSRASPASSSSPHKSAAAPAPPSGGQFAAPFACGQAIIARPPSHRVPNCE